MAGQVTRFYGDVSLRDNASAHLGDSHTHHHYHHEPPDPVLRNEKRYQLLLDSLSFPRLDARLRNVESAIPRTCEWLQSHCNFVAWSDHSRVQEHHGLLWIKGKPGSGKSTIMKKTLEWATRTWGDASVLSYFFNARAANALEKSSVGLYRSLVHQLCSKSEIVRLPFVTCFSTKIRNEAGTLSESNIEPWDEVELQEFILQLVMDKKTASCNLFVDALDEGDEDDVRRLIRFLERLADQAILVGSTFRLCISSRHYPNIRTSFGLSVILDCQTQHADDINLYIESAFGPDSNPNILHVKRRLLEKADHVFLWVVLSISQLKPLYDKGRILAMRKKLEEIPVPLYDLFAALILMDTEDIDECCTLFLWVFSSLRPLSPRELYIAVQARHSSINDVDRDIDDVTINNYILDCSRGLVEIKSSRTTWSVSRDYRVQFVHETVRQFLLSNSLERAQFRWAPGVDFEFKDSHALLAEHCLSILINLAEKVAIIEDCSQQTPSRAVRFANLKKGCDQLIEYTAEFWWQHMQKVSKVKHSKAFNLAVTLLFDASASLLTWQRYYYLPWGRKNFPLQPEPRQKIIHYIARIEILELAEELLYRELFTIQELDEAFCSLCLDGFYAAAKILLDAGVDVNTLIGGKNALLHAAALRGDEAVVKLLVYKGANVNAPGGKDDSAVRTILLKNKKFSYLPLDAGIRVNQLDQDISALHRATHSGHISVMKLLLDAGADVNASDSLGHPPLQTAAFNGDYSSVDLLLDYGADPNSSSSSTLSTALHIAALGGFTSIVELLLRKGAVVNAQAIKYGSALQAAVLANNLSIVEILLQRGADFDALIGIHGTILQAAAICGFSSIFFTLLRHGASKSLQYDCWRPLFEAEMPQKYEDCLNLLMSARQTGEWNSPWPDMIAIKFHASSQWRQDRWNILAELLADDQDFNVDPMWFGGNQCHLICTSVSDGWPETVSLLFRRGMRPTGTASSTQWGMVLLVASRHGWLDVVEYLLLTFLSGPDYDAYCTHSFLVAQIYKQTNIIAHLNRVQFQWTVDVMISIPPIYSPGLIIEDPFTGDGPGFLLQRGKKLFLDKYKMAHLYCTCFSNTAPVTSVQQPPPLWSQFFSTEPSASSQYNAHLEYPELQFSP